jgi:hypothetical protein
MSHKLNWSKANRDNLSKRREKETRNLPTKAGGTPLVTVSEGKFVKEGREWLAAIPLDSKNPPKTEQVKTLRTRDGKKVRVYLKQRRYETDLWEVWTFERRLEKERT